MKLSTSVGAAALLALVAATTTTSSAEAATIVSSGTSATFTFDIQDPAALTRVGFSCSPLCTEGDDPDNWFASEANFGLHFGTTMGGSEIGTAYASNSLDTPMAGGSTPLIAAPGDWTRVAISIPELSGLSLFVTVFFVDDNFGVGSLRLMELDDVWTQYHGTEVSPVPLPAALPLFMAALAGMGLLGWRRKRALA